MFNLPDRYKTDVKVALKDFIPKDLKPNDKKRIKDAVKEVRLVYQIAGEEIPIAVTGQIGHGIDSKAIMIGKEIEIYGE